VAEVKAVAVRAIATLVVALAGGAVVAQQVVRLELLATLTADGGVTHAATFSPNGKAIAIGGERGDLLVLDMPGATKRWAATPSDHWIGTLAYSPDGSVLACCGGHLTLHDAANGRELRRVEHTGPHGFAWHPDGTRYAASTSSVAPGRVDVFEAKEHVRIASFAFRYPAKALAYAADGTLYVGDNVSRVWRIAPAGGESELVVDRRAKPSDNTRSLAIASAGGVWFELASAGPLRRGDREFPVEGIPYGLSVTPDGGSFATGGKAGIVQWWTDGGDRSRTLPVDGEVAALAFQPDGRSLFVATYAGSQAVHRDDGSVAPLPGHAAGVHGVAMSPDGSVVAVRGLRNDWQVVPMSGGAPRRLAGAIEVTAGRRGNELLVAWPTRAVVIDGATGKDLVDVDATTYHPGFTVVGPGNTLCCGDDDALIDCATRARTPFPKELLLHGSARVAHAVAGTWALGSACGIEGDLGALWVTDARGRTLHTEHDGPLYSLAFSPDGKQLWYLMGQGMSVGMGPPKQVLRVRNTSDFALEREVEMRLSTWRFLDARYALTAVDGELQVWDVATLRPVQTVATATPVHWFQLAADARTIAWSNRREVLVHRVHRVD
jgi:WD40 repeat protein